MASIAQHLKKILSAMYGEDVRNAIHDSIDAINKEVIDYGATASKKAAEAARKAAEEERRLYLLRQQESKKTVKKTETAKNENFSSSYGTSPSLSILCNLPLDTLVVK